MVFSLSKCNRVNKVHWRKLSQNYFSPLLAYFKFLNKYTSTATQSASTLPYYTQNGQKLNRVLDFLSETSLNMMISVGNRNIKKS